MNIIDVRVYTRVKSLDAFALMQGLQYGDDMNSLVDGDGNVVYDIVRHEHQNIIGLNYGDPVPDEILHPKKEKKVKEPKEPKPKKEKTKKPKKAKKAQPEAEVDSDNEE